MYTLKYNYRGINYEASLGTLEEILSVAVDVFNKSGELYSIYEGENLKFQHSEIYALIGKRYY